MSGLEDWTERSNLEVKTGIVRGYRNGMRVVRCRNGFDIHVPSGLRYILRNVLPHDAHSRVLRNTDQLLAVCEEIFADAEGCIPPGALWDMLQDLE